MIIGGQYKVLKKIGKGAYGEVYLVSEINFDEKYAVKQVSKGLLKDEINKIYFNNEVYILKHLPSHPNIVKYYRLIETLTNFYVVLDYCNGDTLEKLIKSKNELSQKLTEDECRVIIKQILKALHMLNNNSIIHRDIKSDNILLNYKTELDKDNMNVYNATIKLIDFGFARYLRQDNLAESIVGTPLYMDPFILKGFNKKVTSSKNIEDLNGTYDYRTDLWSVGIVLFEMLFGYMPYEAYNSEDLANRINNQTFCFHSDERIILSKSTINFIGKLFERDFRLRPYPNELLEDIWFFTNFDDKNDPKVTLISKFDRIKLKSCNDDIKFEDYFQEYEDKKKSSKNNIVYKNNDECNNLFRNIKNEESNIQKKSPKNDVIVNNNNNNTIKDNNNTIKDNKCNVNIKYNNQKDNDNPDNDKHNIQDNDKQDNNNQDNINNSNSNENENNTPTKDPSTNNKKESKKSQIAILPLLSDSRSPKIKTPTRGHIIKFKINPIGKRVDKLNKKESTENEQENNENKKESYCNSVKIRKKGSQNINKTNNIPITKHNSIKSNHSMKMTHINQLLERIRISNQHNHNEEPIENDRETVKVNFESKNIYNEANVDKEYKTDRIFNK